MPASIQQRILPESLPRVEGYDVAGINIPSKSVGGDYYDCIPLDGGRLALVIADVAGKGVPAALLVSSFHAYLGAYLEAEVPLVELVARLNRVIAHASTEDKFITAFFALLDPASGSLDSVNAGHNPVFLRRADGTLTELTQGGIPLGMMDMDYPYQSESLVMGSGDRLLLYTDGIPEATDGRMKLYDEDFPLRDFVTAHVPDRASAFIAELIADVRKFTGAAPAERRHHRALSHETLNSSRNGEQRDNADSLYCSGARRAPLRVRGSPGSGDGKCPARRRRQGGIPPHVARVQDLRVGHDELKPLSRSYHDWYGAPFYMTAMDAMDTMILMGLKDDADSTREFIATHLSFDRDVYVKNFEFTIRFLGGLLATYQMTADGRLLALAQDLGTRLLPAFGSPTGMPYVEVNLRTGAVRGTKSNPAEIGTLLLEFGTLSKLTGDARYYAAAKKALTVLYGLRSDRVSSASRSTSRRGNGRGRTVT